MVTISGLELAKELAVLMSEIELLASLPHYIGCANSPFGGAIVCIRCEKKAEREERLKIIVKAAGYDVEFWEDA